MKVVVIIPAAGLGTRMAPMPSAADAKKKAHPSKQFTELADRKKNVYDQDLLALLPVERRSSRPDAAAAPAAHSY